MNKTLKFALQYKKLGFSIFPCIPNGKTPALAWKEYQQRYATNEEIIDWFDNDDELNIGIVTGKISNLAVIDYDEPTKYKPVNSPTVKTPRGYHIYCNWQNGITNSSLKDDIKKVDIRGSGGFVVAPASIVNDIKYTWIPDKTPNIRRLEVPKKYLKPPKFDRKSPRLIGKGDRNNTLFKVCCEKVKQFTYTEYYEKVFTWNQSLSHPLDENEVERTINNVFNNHKEYILKQLNNLMYEV